MPISVYTINPTGGAINRSIAGYSTVLDQFLLLENDPTTFIYVDAVSFTLTAATLDPDLGPNLIQSAYSNSTSCDDAGYWYSNRGGDPRYACVWDKTSHLLLHQGGGWPPAFYLGPPIVKVLKDNSTEHAIFMDDNDGQIASYVPNTFALEGFVNLTSPQASVTPLVAAYDKNNLLWGLSYKVKGNNLDSFLVSTDNTFAAPLFYTVSGAVYGQPMTMWYNKADHSFIMQTATGYITKWDIATHTIVGHVDHSAIIGAADYDVSIAIGKNGWDSKQVWISDGNYKIYTINPDTLGVISSYNLRTILGIPSFGLRTPCAFIPEKRVLIAPQDAFTSTPWKFVAFPPYANSSRMIFINT